MQIARLSLGSMGSRPYRSSAKVLHHRVGIGNLSEVWGAREREDSRLGLPELRCNTQDNTTHGAAEVT